MLLVSKLTESAPIEPENSNAKRYHRDREQRERERVEREREYRDSPHPQRWERRARFEKRRFERSVEERKPIFDCLRWVMMLSRS